ncbi:MAG TPA: hypothetical protein VES67_24670 [Vicinamibacterales bacterium]|nr:hypothetical protein [Vicinamibacterales bacterium]
MCSAKDLNHRVTAYYGRVAADAHHRYRSWEHCYRFFKSRTRENLIAEKDAAALQLGFYLASWGMYRGSAFLLQRAYTVHTGVVERLASPQFAELWDKEVGSDASDVRLVPLILAAVAAIKEAYAPFGGARDTLVTKVLLGTMACLPACDRFFIDGFKKSGNRYSSVNERFVQRILRFCSDCGTELRGEQSRIEADGGIHYPLMKLADMYFWQIGYEAAARKAGGESKLTD